MLRVYEWHGTFWRFEDGKAPKDAKLVEVTTRGVTPEAPKRRAVRRTAKPKTEE
jgi:hypothetical protein